MNGKWFRRAAVQTVKPRVSPATWDLLKRQGHAAASLLAGRPKVETDPWADASLTDLAIHFKTDKWGGHRYTPHYERHLAPWRNDAFTMLEIGIGGYNRPGQGGASLRMWKAFFPKAQIIGLDIEDKSFVQEARIKTYRGSQVDEQLLIRVVAEAGPVRVVVDDGSHRPEHIRETFRLLFPLLQDGGLYVIEDTQTSYWPRWGGKLDRHASDTTMALAKDLLDGLNYQEFLVRNYDPTYSDRHVVGVHAYHNMIVVEKGINSEGTNRSKREFEYLDEHPEAMTGG